MRSNPFSPDNLDSHQAGHIHLQAVSWRVSTLDTLYFFIERMCFSNCRTDSHKYARCGTMLPRSRWPESPVFKRPSLQRQRPTLRRVIEVHNPARTVTVATNSMNHQLGGRLLIYSTSLDTPNYRHGTLRCTGTRSSLSLPGYGDDSVGGQSPTYENAPWSATIAAFVRLWQVGRPDSGARIRELRCVGGR